MPASVPLTELDPDVAEAVVAVLADAGVPATIGGPAEGTEGEVVVLVPADRRDDAVRTMTGSMEAISAELRRRRAPDAALGAPRRAGRAALADGDDEDAPPLLFERLRNLSFLPILLVPLLVVTLASVRLPVALAIILVIGGMAGLHAWREGRRAQDD